MDHLHIFLSSPGDVNRERQLARAAIYQIESEPLYRDRFKLEVVAWDKPGAGTAMSAHLEPQEAINRGLKIPSECDIVIVIFWARMGTLLSEKLRKPDGSRYRSGTEYEFLDALNAAMKTDKPDVLVYRRKKPPCVDLDDPKRDEKLRQWGLVEEFFAEFRNPDGAPRRSYQEYEEPSDFKDLLERDLRELITRYLKTHPLGRAKLPGAPEPPIWDYQRSPFPGLRAFTTEEALIFHGRERRIEDLIGKLSDSRNRFIVVVGPSGSGKSSLVAAGLLPALEKNAISGSKDWLWRQFTPGEVGNNPYMALASAFKPMIHMKGIKPRDMASDLETNPTAIHELAAMALEGKPDWAELLIFIDQFEELFTLVDSKYQRAFIVMLVEAAKTARLRTVMTMRADFYHLCLEWPLLDVLLANGQYPLVAPSESALNKMINRPAELAGLLFEEGLAQRILDDTGNEPGALALMAFALFELWQKSKGSDGILTHAAYESFNGVHGAIGKRADDTFNALKGEKSAFEAALAHVFRELVEVDERGVATRRRALLSQVTSGAAAKTLVNALTEARLLVTSRSEKHEPMVEAAHEAIFTNWPRLREWIEVRRDDLRLLRQVRIAVAEWGKQGRDEHFLWPHERLLFVSQMVGRLQPTLSELEREFIRPESERLLEEIECSTTTPQRRAIIGDRLAGIGDPRRGVGLRTDGLPDIVWCKVPSGKITLKGKTGTFLVKSFYISKYPVTWIQYRSFVEAEDGYQNEQWWEGLAQREDEPDEQNRKLDNHLEISLSALVGHPDEQNRKRDNHPAENVSWYDAVAFCRWLTKQMGYEIRLPTEAQWQQAATGGDPGNKYPWGAAWDSDRANNRESGLLRTTAVGLYPLGASPVEVFDMSGNVLEWCLNRYDKPQWIGETGKASRAVRGGSWNHAKLDVCCADRDYFNPDFRDDYVGFRLLCSSPIF